MENIVGKRVQEARQKFRPPLSQEALAVRLELDGWKISRGTPVCVNDFGQQF